MIICESVSGEGAVLQVGGEWIVVDKAFGPTVFDRIRVTPDSVAGEWVVEIQRDLDSDGLETEWREVCRVPGTEGGGST